MKHASFPFARSVLAPLLIGTALVAVPAQAGSKSDRHAEKARAAMDDGNARRAVDYAEKAVIAAPRNAEMRVMLGKAYLEAGRMVSARDSLYGAVALGDSSARTALMLALAQIGANDPRGAVLTLDTAGPAINAADRGLALALAGDTARGAEVVVAAIRAGDSSAKARQNLAYAFALDGRWREARVMAAQDLPANLIDDRITHWATTAQPEQAAQRIASLLGTNAVADAGQPAELALANFPAPEPVVMAAAQPAPVAELAPVDPAPSQASFDLPEIVDMAPIQTVAVAPSAAEFSEPPAAPPAAETKFVSLSVVQKVKEKPAAAKPAPAPAPGKAAPTKVEKPVKVAAKKPEPAPLPQPRSSGTHVAQLGSFTSRDDAVRGWKVFQSRYGNLSSSKPVITRATIDGTDYFRVSAGGFDAQDANAMCRAVKAGGHGCLPIAKPTASAQRLAKVD